MSTSTCILKEGSEEEDKQQCDSGPELYASTNELLMEYLVTGKDMFLVDVIHVALDF